MSKGFIYIIPALIALLGWGIGDLFFALSTRRVGNIKTLFWQLLLATLVTLLYIPNVWPIADYRMLFLAAFLGLFYFFGSLTFFKALEVGNASLVGAITGSFPVVAVLLSYLVYGEKLIWIQILGIALILTGLILVSLKKNDLRNSNYKGLGYALTTMIVWGIYFAFIKIPALYIGWFWPTFSFNLMFILLLIYSLLSKKSLSLKGDFRGFVLIFGATVLTTSALFAYNLAVSRGPVSVVAPIAGSYPVLFILLTRFVFKESLTGKQTLGIMSALLGILFVSFS